jgi:hypothetical protein
MQLSFHNHFFSLELHVFSLNHVGIGWMYGWRNHLSYMVTGARPFTHPHGGFNGCMGGTTTLGTWYSCLRPLSGTGISKQVLPFKN